jgi:hypothetical protein
VCALTNRFDYSVISHDLIIELALLLALRLPLLILWLDPHYLGQWIGTMLTPIILARTLHWRLTPLLLGWALRPHSEGGLFVHLRSFRYLLVALISHL